jgi:quercetin dioxygenase-like cupin family protein
MNEGELKLLMLNNRRRIEKSQFRTSRLQMHGRSRFCADIIIRRVRAPARLKLMNVRSLATFSPDKYRRVPIEDAKGLMRLLCFEPGQSVAPHIHPKSDEFFFVVEGKGRITIGREKQDAQSGCIIRVAAGVTHRWNNGAYRLILLSVLIPTSAYVLVDEATEQKFV